MRTWSKLGLFVGILAVGAGCIAPPPKAESAPKPGASARASSSAITKKVSGGITKWRIYEGRTSVVVLGFGKDKKPVNGMRFRYASTKARKWAVSLEMVKGNGAVQIDKKGKVIRDTMTVEDGKVLFGATRVLEKWARGLDTGSGTGTKNIAFADGSDCLKGAGKAVKTCAPVAAKCVRAAVQGSRLGVPGALLNTGRCLWQNKGAVVNCAYKTYDAVSTCKEAFTDKDKKDEQKNPPPEDKEKDKPVDDPKEEPKPDEQPDAGTEEPKPEDQDAGPKEDEPLVASDDPEKKEDGTEVASADEDPETAAALSPEEQQEDQQAAEEDPEDAPVEEEVEEQSEEQATTDDEVDPDPPEAQEEAPEEEAQEEPQEESQEPAAEDPPPASDEGALVASLRAKLGLRAVSTSRASSGGACRGSQVLVCGSTKSVSYCRCVK